MALTLTELQAVTDEYYEGRPVDIFFTENVLLYKLLGKGMMKLNLIKASDLIDGGEKIRTFFEFAAAHSGRYGNTTLIPQSRKDIMNAARWRYAGYFAANAIDLNERRANSGGAAVVDLAYAKIQNIEKTIRDTMGREIFDAAADDDAWLGLGDLFNTSTSTKYGEVAEDDVPLWKANVITTSRAISFKVMQEIFRTPAIGQGRSKKPNLCVTTETLKDGYERTLQVQQRFSDQDLVEAGFDNVLHKRAPIVADDNQAVGRLDALNLNYLKIKTHKDFNFTKPKWEYDKEQPDTFVANVRYSGQLVCTHRKAHVRHDNLTEPT